MKKFKLIALLMAGTMLISGCAAEQQNPQDSGDSSVSSTPQEEEKSYDGEMRGLSVQELVGEMKTGWNLGNTFDATDGETSWGNPVTTHEMIDAVAAAGFDLIRIPITWEKHFDNETDYTINAEWMARVTEVVNYAFDNDMYVIINCHHETDWIKPTMADVDGVLPKYKAMWTQIAENFKNYGDKLLFEGLNEPRTVGGANEWNGGTEDGRQALNILNKAFVETVRSTGGNNSTRALLITTFAAAVAENTMSELEIPDDPNIIISLHAYTPYDFTYEDGRNLFEYDDSVGQSIDWTFDLIDKYFTSKDIPVIITEYGSVNKIIDFSVVPNPRYAENVKWVTKYIGRAEESGIPCVWWDNGTHFGSGELFGIFNRSDCTWYAEDLVKAIMDTSK